MKLRHSLAFILRKVPWTSRVFAFVTILCLVSDASRCSAGELTMIGTPQLSTREDGEDIVLEGFYEIENRGDEIAARVYPALELGVFRWSGDPKQISPLGKARWEISERLNSAKVRCDSDVTCAGLKLPTRGEFPLRITRYYQDLSGAQFSSCDILPLLIGTLSGEERYAAQVPAIGIRVRAEGDGQNFSANVDLSQTTADNRSVSVSIITPTEINSSLQAKVVALDAMGQLSVPFELTNRSAFPGSRYIVHAVVQWEEQGVRATASSNVALAIHDVGKRSKFYGVAAVVAILAGLLLFVALKTNSKRT